MRLYRIVENNITSKFIHAETLRDALNLHYQEEGYVDFEDYQNKNGCDDPDVTFVELEHFDENVKRNLRGHNYDYGE